MRFRSPTSLLGVALWVAATFTSTAGLAAPPSPRASAATSAIRRAGPAPSSSAEEERPRPAPSLDETTVIGATPRRALAGFLEAAEKRDYSEAAEYLDLRGVPPQRRQREGVELASMLHRVLIWSVALRLDDVPDEAELDEGNTVVIQTLELNGAPVPVVLERSRSRMGAAWRFSAATVAKVRALYEAQERRVVEERMPDVLTRRTFLSLAPWQWLGLPAGVLLAWVVARLLGGLVLRILARALQRVEPEWLRAAAEAASSPIRLMLGVGLFVLVEPYLMLQPFAALIVSRAALMIAVFAGAWASIAFVRTGTRAVAAGLPGDTVGELETRGLKTRLLMIERIAAVGIALIALSVVLLQFEVVRTVGLSLLASAGIAGIVLGVAAQRTLGGVISGIELAFSQPLRLGDTVVVEGEWGIVEEMYFTYVVIRCFDDRRLMVPVARLLSMPFENWTRGSPDMLPTVELFADYRLPVERLRAEALRLIEDNPLWDGRVAKLQVTDVSDRTIKMRIMASVDNASKGFQLRCELREALVAYLQQLDGGRYLPRSRVDEGVGRANTEGAQA